jgi:hypothetical protein
MLGAHTLLRVEGGEFISLLDPPSELAPLAKTCVNENTWPVLVGGPGSTDCVLSSPIILYDYPRVAAESVTGFHDATEIDEMLTLRVMTLTEEEKREVARTDDRARRILEETEAIPDELFARLHGVVRSLEGFGEAAVDPLDAAVVVCGTRVARGARVRLHPRPGADAHDMFVEGRTARVEAIYTDVDDATHVAVTIEDDPAADLHREARRFLYFGLDEIEPVERGNRA